ncbi:hypothetical protein GN958_ATG06611 [Phytophthora infestans]|uniref:Uncharacterized protein n=1 Tax=Phytophthora infestans TaxID=4787 RepID=A0A8S9UUC0_PHYIN|nr:hypothetical protein GN958_ATG06611 [Phytophthora infestans]
MDGAPKGVEELPALLNPLAMAIYSQSDTIQEGGHSNYGLQDNPSQHHPGKVTTGTGITY